MTCTDPKIDVVNTNAYLKFGDILSICSQDIERKQTFDLNQGPELWYKFGKNDMKQFKARSCQYKCIYKIW